MAKLAVIIEQSFLLMARLFSSLLKKFKDMRGLDKKEGIYRKEILIVILLLSEINKKCKRLGKN